MHFRDWLKRFYTQLLSDTCWTSVLDEIDNRFAVDIDQVSAEWHVDLVVLVKQVRKPWRPIPHGIRKSISFLKLPRELRQAILLQTYDNSHGAFHCEPQLRAFVIKTHMLAVQT